VIELRRAKGAARTTKPVRNCFAPHSVLREFLKSREPTRYHELIREGCGKEHVTPRFLLNRPSELFFPAGSRPITGHRSIERTCTSRCGHGISIFFSRNTRKISMNKSLFSEPKWSVMIVVETRRLRLTLLSPNPVTNTVGAGSARTCPSRFAISNSTSRTISRSLSQETPSGIVILTVRSFAVQFATPEVIVDGGGSAKSLNRPACNGCSV
jgi:hypothetical protein